MSEDSAPVPSVPRRARLDLITPAERAIYDAVTVVESSGADVRLTDAVILLQAARDSVADFVDKVERRRSVRVVEVCPSLTLSGPCTCVDAQHVGWAGPSGTDTDIPMEVQRDLMQCAVANGRISYYYLCDVFRRGRATPPNSLAPVVTDAGAVAVVERLERIKLAVADHHEAIANDERLMMHASWYDVEWLLSALAQRDTALHEAQEALRQPARTGCDDCSSPQPRPHT